MFTMGANLDEETWDTSKNKPKQTSNKTIAKVANSDCEANFPRKNQHQLVFTFEKRNGKPVTLVGRFELAENEKKSVLKLLKKKLGTGGTINNEWIEIQGDKKDAIIKVLESDGWKFRKK